MKQENCRPCQGIQSLTPVSNRNLPGQTGLRYRVGRYPEFFESMLAALSGGTLSRNPSPQELEQTVLRHLTARETDDPSIAMLDAWAVLADVLTFYNERYANEAYLRTARQSSSLFELANMVGYTPRPGLSSSVYLAFDVDDKSNTVLIEAGTQAKSTPIPGRGQSPQTFETSVDFTARPSFNKIRPRLNRPQQLARSFWPNLDRIYLKGTGLRIGPNDYLTITSSDGGESVPFRVASIEERTNTPDRYTVVYLDENEMMPKKLVRAVQQHLRSFVDSDMVASLLSATYVSELRDRATSKLLKLIPNGNDALESIDRVCEANVLGAMLDQFKEPQSDLTAIEKSLEKDAQAFILGAAYDGAVSDFKTAHRSTTVNDWKAKVANVNTGNETKKAVERIKAIHKLCDVSDGKVLVAVQPMRTRTTLPGLLFEGDIQMVDEPTTISSAQLTIEAIKNGVVPNSVDTSPLSSIRAAFDNWKISSWAGTDKQLIYWTLTIDEGETTQTVRHGVTGVGKGGTGDFFEQLIPDRIIMGLHAGGDCKIDPNMNLVQSTSTTVYSVTIQLVSHPSGVGTVKNKSIPKQSGRNLNRQINDLKLSDFVSSNREGTYVFKYTIQNNADEVVAFAVRTLIVPRDPVFNSLPRQVVTKVAAALDRFYSDKAAMDLDALLRAIDDAFNVCDEIESSSVWTASRLLEKSLTIDVDVRSDLIDRPEQLFFKALSDLYQIQLNKLNNAPLNSNLHREYAALKEEFANKSPTTGDDSSAYSSSKAWLLEYEDNCPKQYAKITGMRDRMAQLVDSLEDYALLVLKELHTRRAFIVDKLELAFKTIQSSLLPADQNSVNAKIGELKTKLDELDELVKRRGSHQGPGVRWQAIHDNECSLTTVKELINDRSTPSALLPAWQKIVETFSPTKPPQQPIDPDAFKRILSEYQAVSSGALSTASLAQLIQKNAALWPQVKAALGPSLREKVFAQFQSFRNEKPDKNEVWVFRSAANLFGWNSKGRQLIRADRVPEVYPTLLTNADLASKNPSPNSDLEAPSSLFLDGKFPKTAVRAPILILHPTKAPKVFTVGRVAVEPRNRYLLSSDSTRVELGDSQIWWTPVSDLDDGTASQNPDHIPDRKKDGFFVIQNTKVYCDAELMELADEVLEDSQPFIVHEPSSTTSILTLDVFSPELEVNSKVIVSGDVASRDDLTSSYLSDRQPGTSTTSEQVQIVRVAHRYDENLFNDPFRTEIEFSPALSNSYWTTSVNIQANVVEATHGETVPEVLGSGDTTKPFQKFWLSRKAVTRLSAPNPSGKREALEVKVNSTTWDQTSQLVDSAPQDEVFELKGNRSDATSHIQFGNGLHGSRLPTGIENVKAIYRVGLGETGNVQPGQINQLPSPPPGVKSVTNPFPGDGGANADTIYQTRTRIPLSAASIGRLVSKKDFESFAMLFAGIDKVSVVEEKGNLKLYIAGNTPAPISKDGQLHRNFTEALSLQGEEYGQIEVEPHNGLLLHLQAGVRIDARYDWDNVKREIEARLLKRFGYQMMRMGQQILASEVVETIQSVEHVRYVSLVRFIGLSSGKGESSPDSSRLTYSPDGKGNAGSALTLPQAITVLPNEVCYIDDVVTSTVQLERLA